MKIKDLAGKKFGKLLVLEYVDSKKGRSKWRCRCDCGAIKVIYANSLKTNNTKSCGCLLTNIKINLTGKKFGKLRVIEFVERKKSQTWWKCKCDCGNVKNVNGRSLKDGQTKSCGCIKSCKLNLIGKKFERWLVLKYIKGGKWECKCECGAIKNVYTNSLIHEKSKSCGCLSNELKSKRKIKDLTGKKFNRWTVIEILGHNDFNQILWKCKCECGTIRNVNGNSLKQGTSKSCGCLQKEINSKRTRLDLAGKKFGKLTVLEYVGMHKNNGSMWKCQCDCGNIKNISANALKRKIKGTVSCGCIKREVGRLLRGEAGFNMVLASYRRGAKNRNLEFSLTKEEFKYLTQQKCYYCGIDPSSVMHNKGSTISIDGRNWSEYVYNGIDRIDNFKGYVMENCVTCCGVCNRMKMDIGIKEFLKLIKRIYENKF